MFNLDRRDIGAMKKNQQRIEMILDSKKIAYEKIDIASNEEGKNKMRELIGDEHALPPQLFNDDTYLGDFAAFDNAVEGESLEAFLKI
ncbi:SH3 domain-binding glutamic acid-rich protein homolog isoform X2 [Acanthaster planci]|uniref:SH3 domain-binding glutamic acid-rich protein homolog isoform X2 n=1 Tax=Acanthaster planci TaxID=133434 RepID=A0A8B7XNT6_ACAPL|nr:SH3 domain-binding glutamic acid-rich protein homolog isoform X2 [Acanthaster planci]